MDYLIDIFFSVPFLFWNLLWLGDFHFGLLIFLYFRLKRTRSQGLVLSEIGFELPSITVVLPLLRLGYQDLACVRALLSQDHPNYRLRIALDASAPRGELDLAQLEAVLGEYPAIAWTSYPAPLLRTSMPRVAVRRFTKPFKLASGARAHPPCWP